MKFIILTLLITLPSSLLSMEYTKKEGCSIFQPFDVERHHLIDLCVEKTPYPKTKFFSPLNTPHNPFTNNTYTFKEARGIAVYQTGEVFLFSQHDSNKKDILFTIPKTIENDKMTGTNRKIEKWFIDHDRLKFYAFLTFDIKNNNEPSFSTKDALMRVNLTKASKLNILNTIVQLSQTKNVIAPKTLNHLINTIKHTKLFFETPIDYDENITFDKKLTTPKIEVIAWLATRLKKSTCTVKVFENSKLHSIDPTLTYITTYHAPTKDFYVRSIKQPSALFFPSPQNFFSLKEITFSPQKHTCLVMALLPNNKSIKLLDTFSSYWVELWSKNNCDLSNLTFSATGNLFFGNKGDTLFVVKTATGTVLTTIPLKNETEAVTDISLITSSHNTLHHEKNTLEIYYAKNTKKALFDYTEEKEIFSWASPRYLLAEKIPVSDNTIFNYCKDL